MQSVTGQVTITSAGPLLHMTRQESGQRFTTLMFGGTDLESKIDSLPPFFAHLFQSLNSGYFAYLTLNIGQ